MRALSLLAATLAVLALWAAPASAHAFPTKIEPSVGGTFEVAPTQVKISYTMGVQPGLGFIEVKSAGGTVVSLDQAQVSGDDGNVLTEQLNALAPGRYQVAWHVLAVDGHTTQGHFAFTVKAPPKPPDGGTGG